MLPLRTEREVSRSLLRIGLGLLLIFPYLVWIYAIPSWDLPSFTSRIFAKALMQATLSTSGAFVLGFLLLHAHWGWSSGRARKWSRWMLLAPNFVPALFLALSLLSLATAVVPFPYGMSLVVAAHVLLNAGLVAIALENLIQTRAAGMLETAWLLGASRTQFWRELGWPHLRGDLACVFLFVLSLCLTSFSLPLLLGGGQDLSLEMGIYQSVRLEGRWDKAVMLAFSQTAFLLLLAGLLPRRFWPDMKGRNITQNSLLAWSPGRLLTFLPMALLLAGWGMGFTSGAIFSPGWSYGLAEAIFNSMLLGFSVGGLHLIMFIAVGFALPHDRLDRFLNGYLAPSPSLIGFALVLIPCEGELVNFAKLTLALTLITFPVLYRWMVHSAFARCRGQIAIARTLGASWRQIFGEVVWPQSAHAVMMASGLGAFWGCGDFALSALFLPAADTLPLVMEHWIRNYQFGTAQLIMLILAAVGGLQYFFFVKAAEYVGH